MADETAAAGGKSQQDKRIDPVAGKSVAEIFGEIVWLMSQDAASRELRLRTWNGW